MHSIAQLSQLFEQYTKQQTFSRKPDLLYRPVEYMLGLGGKRLRPILVMLSAELFGRNPQDMLPQAFAVELFHNFSLIHDDIMDQASIRRGKETVHVKFNPRTAILSGDVMLVWAYEYLLRNDPNHIAELMHVFNRTAMEVCEGQQMDLDFENRIPSTESYIEMITLKTAALLGGALRIGAILADAASEDAERLYQFGMNTGIAFQLLDDILDTFSTSEEFGKRIGGDIVQNKKSILLLNAMQDASEQQLAYIHHWLNIKDDDNQKIEAMKKLYIETGAEAKARAMVRHYHHKALEAIASVSVREERKHVLTNFSESLLNRTH